MLNRANIVLGIYKASTGGVWGTVADPKLIFGAAIKTFLLSHNHPSGQLNPSDAEIHFTKKLKDGGKFLEIQVLDHIIITSEEYYSFADEGAV